MGLIKAGLGAVKGTLADQWKDFFYCESIDVNILVVKGQKRTDKRSSNTRGTENIIVSGSKIAIADGQAMIIVEQGKIVEFCAEPGEYIFDSSLEPSIFEGALGDGVKKTFIKMAERFTFGGQATNDQRIYYFNLKEIIGNKYGTPNPIPFRVVDNNIGLDIDISVRCHGKYSYRIIDPLLFYTNVCGNVDHEYRRDQIDGMLKSELLKALQPAFAKLSAMGIRHSALPGHTMELADALNDILSAKWSEHRGISIVSFGVSSVTIPPEDEKMIKELQRTAVMRNPGMAGASLVAAQSDAMKSAAENPNGAMMGFMGMNAAMNAAPNTGSFFDMAGQEAKQAQNAGGWKCECGAVNKGKFCSECGKPQPVDTTWQCECGAKNKGKFCSECGKARLEEWKCECGTMNKGNFCNECGKKKE